MENEVNEPAPKYNYISPDEYLEMERSSDEKHEYYNGFVVAMSGARLRHVDIFGNLFGEVKNFLRGKDCRPLGSDMRVCTPERDAYVYPDMSIVCGEPKLEDDKFDTLTNPSVVVEILSRSTRKIDTKYKFLYYQSIPTVKEYIMIESEKRHIQAIRKQDDGDWRIEELSQQDAVLLIQTIGFRISMADIYQHTGL
jgi:Uma2 family endonuclease